mmetsp:Transcript_13709/g.51130  ORF Transcript_13709/g.51130 Transcript_13709/m.51130 type:complete len:303 (+) Transcript_13709:844-1752(+)|eukprot:scaffold4077_cov257-Pinguiococcus_pyrenoidosus.AAC.2
MLHVGEVDRSRSAPRSPFEAKRCLWTDTQQIVRASESNVFEHQAQVAGHVKIDLEEPVNACELIVLLLFLFEVQCPGHAKATQRGGQLVDDVEPHGQVELQAGLCPPMGRSILMEGVPHLQLIQHVRDRTVISSLIQDHAEANIAAERDLNVLDVFRDGLGRHQRGHEVHSDLFLGSPSCGQALVLEDDATFLDVLDLAALHRHLRMSNIAPLGGQCSPTLYAENGFDVHFAFCGMFVDALRSHVKYVQRVREKSFVRQLRVRSQSLKDVVEGYPHELGGRQQHDDATSYCQQSHFVLSGVD